jgi:peptidoglycan/LPS O-acetylase OafA/YrhL
MQSSSNSFEKWSPAYRPDIDGLRAIAVVTIVGFHYSPTFIPGGFVGVDIFFVISGYLITTIVLRRIERDAFLLRDFYVRRICRIFPALIIVLMASALYGWLILFPFEFKQLGKHIAAGAGFVSNIASWRESGYFDSSGELKPLLHLWSLGIEEQFYIIWPALILLTWKCGYRVRYLVVFIAITSFSINVLSLSSHSASSFYSPLARFWELLVGGELATAETAMKKNNTAFQRQYSARRSLANAKSCVGMVMLVIAIIGLDDTVSFPGWWALFPTVGTYLLISAGQTAWINRSFLSNRLLVFFGLISFPLYLWHWPLLAYTRIVENQLPSSAIKFAAFGLSILLAYLTFRFVERPARHGKYGPSLAILLSIIMAVIGVAGLLGRFAIIAPRSASDIEVQKWDRYIQSPDWQSSLSRLRASSFENLNIYFGGPWPPKVLFFGDSHVGHFVPRLTKLLTDTPATTRAFAVAWGAGCAPIPHVMDIEHSCRNFVDQVSTFVRTSEIDTIVISAFWNWYFDEPSIIYEDDTFSGPLDTGSQAANRAWRAFANLVAEFIGQGKAVYIILPTPYDKDNDPKSMIRRSFFGGFEEIHASSPRRADFVAGSEKVSTKLREIAGLTGATIIDPINTFCNELICPSTMPDGEPIYSDSDHIRPFFAMEYLRFLDETILKR